MATKQTRRSVSLNGEVYAKLKKMCEEIERPTSYVVQHLVEAFLQERKIGDVPAAAARVAKKVVTGEGPLRGGGVHLI